MKLYMNMLKDQHWILPFRIRNQGSQNSAKSFSKKNVDVFFSNLSSGFNDIMFEVHRIRNMDEYGCLTVSSKAVKSIAQKGKERVSSQHIDIGRVGYQCASRIVR